MVLLDDLLTNKITPEALSDQELLQAFKDSPYEVLRKVRWSEPLGTQRMRLSRLIQKGGQEINSILKNTVEKNPALRPITRPKVETQTQAEAAQTEIPERTAEELEKTAVKPAPQPRERAYTPEQAKHLELLLKQLSKSYFDYYEKVAHDPRSGLTAPESASRLAISSGAQVAGQHLTNWLTQARGNLAPYLDGATGEMVKTFLGPIGDAWRLLESVDTKLYQTQSISPLLDPYAIDRAVKKLEHQSFEVIRAPFRLGFAILANAGLPGVKVLYSMAQVYNEYAGKYGRNKYDRKYGQVEFQPITRIVPTAFYKLFSFTEKTADRIDRWTKSPTGHLLEHVYQHQFLHDLNHAIKIHKHARDAYRSSKSEISRKAFLSASKNLSRLMDRYDGRNIISYKKGKILNQLGADAGNFFRGISRRSLTNIAKHLRRTDRDPLTYLGALVGGILWELVGGTAINSVGYALSRIMRLVPGYNVVRAYIAEGILGSPTATSARIFGTNLRSLFKGTLSLNTFSSFYLGSQLGQVLFPNSPFAIAPGILSGGLGAFYTTGLINITNGTPLIDIASGAPITLPGLGAMPAQVQWYFEQTQTGPLMRRAFWGLGGERPGYMPTSRILGYDKVGIETNLKYFDPLKQPRLTKWLGATNSPWSAPITRFSAFLWRHPYFRLPIKGFALRSLLLNLLPPQVLAMNIVGIPVG